MARDAWVSELGFWRCWWASSLVNLCRMCDDDLCLSDPLIAAVSCGCLTANLCGHDLHLRGISHQDRATHVDAWWHKVVTKLHDCCGGASQVSGLELWVKTLDLSRVGYTGNDDVFASLPCWKHCSGLIFMVKTQDQTFGGPWLDPTTMVFQHHFLPRDVVAA